MKGLQIDRDSMFSIKDGITCVLVVETKCNVLLVKKEIPRVILKS